MISRRKLLGGLTAFIAAPAIIRVADMMPIKAFGVVDDGFWFNAAECEALNEASVARMAAYIAQRQAFQRALWPGVMKFWSERFRADDWQGLFEQKHLLSPPNHPIGPPID